MPNGARPILVIPKEQAVTRIDERIALGKRLLNNSINSNEALNQIRAEYNKWSKFNGELLKTIFKNNSLFEEYNLCVGFVSSAHPTLSEKIGRIHKDIQEKIERLDSIKDRMPLFQEELSVIHNQKGVSKEMKTNKIFIVHGHDEAFKQSVARVVEKLGLEAIILHEKPNAGLTLIEKLETYADVGFALVLLSPDDEGKNIKEPNLKPRARQNVIAELGYFVGKLGRKNVCSLYIEGVEIPSDFSGVLYIPFDDAGKWKFDLVGEFKNAGYNVDANKLV